MEPLKVDIKNCCYKAIIGVGGIGSGMFFQLNDVHTLGREESRSGYFLDRRDYCKLHIISHYVQVLLGKDFRVIPVGKIGDDDIGKRLIEEMTETGFEMDYLGKSSSDQTLFSFCFVYPDGCGGNMTTGNSACSKVDESFVKKAEPEFIKYEGKGITLAAPEVTLEARAALLDMGVKYNFFKVASFTSEEIRQAIQAGLIKHVDLLALNFDETAAAVEMAITENSPSLIIETAIEIFKKINPKIILSITKGKDGSWLWDGRSLTHVPIFPVKVKNTAGAGDAFVAGLIVGITVGLNIEEAHQFASITASSSVESRHTINKETDKISIKIIADNSKKIIKENVYNLLKD